ncbi:MAG: hypothetical protein WBP58_01875 [Chitinophagaceae bacterium]
MADIEFFAEQPNYFWHWDDEGEVIAIPKGGTIAYREHLRDIMSGLVAQGLPPFGALLLAIAATNNEGQKNIETIYALIMQQIGQDEANANIVQDAVAFMQKLALLPVHLRKGTNRILLMQTIFAQCHRVVSIKNSGNFFGYFQSPRFTISSFKQFQELHFRNDFRAIGILNRRFPNVDAIVNRMAGLPLVDEPVNVEPDESATSENDIAAQLQKNPKTFHIGSLIKTLWSGLNIPHHSVNPGIQPLGGFSGIVNKGNYDKLLSSEFAYDDLVFLSRIANNEALFIQREIPPHKHNLERIILIDVSLRNWGTPKTMAYALAIAIASHPKTDIPCKAYALGNLFTPVHLTSISEIIESLNHLDSCLNCSKGLELFLSSKVFPKGAELILITHAETIKSPDLQIVIQNNYKLFHYWIQTQTDGSIDLYRRQQNSKRHIQHLKLNLGEHWHSKKKSTQHSPIREDGILPILLPLPQSSRLITLHNHNQHIFALTPNKDVLMSAKTKDFKDNGWRLIRKQLPIEPGQLAIGQMSSGEWLLLNFEPGNNRLTLFNLTNPSERTTFFTAWQSHEDNCFAFEEDCFLYLETGVATTMWTIKWGDVITISSEKLTTILIPKMFSGPSMRNKLNSLRVPNKNMLKKVTNVFINQVKNLVFNTHELRIVNDQVIKLANSQFISPLAYAEKITDNTFQFSDQSTITVRADGVVVLKSSDQGIAEIYIPLVLDMSLGVATATHFSGNKFFLDENKSQLIQEPSKFWKENIQDFISNILTDEN